MVVSDWLRPPRHLVVLFLGIALTLMAALAWLGWRLFQQDEVLEAERVRARLESAADAVSAELARRLGAVGDGLARLATVSAAHLPEAASRFAVPFSADAAVLVVDGEEMAAYPAGRLRYYPAPASAPQPDARLFVTGEALEFRRQDLSAAAHAYRALAGSPDSLVRAAALLRLARVERKDGHPVGALDVYARLAALGSTPVEGLPAGLVAGEASLAVLSDLRRRDTLQRRAHGLYADLRTGRWRLSRPQYEFYRDQICRWTSCEPDSAAAGVSALADGAAWLWDRRDVLAAAGDEMAQLDGESALVVWRRSGERLVALVGGSRHLSVDWIGAIRPLLDRQGVRVALSDANGSVVTPPVHSTRHLRVTRTMSDTRLPWTLDLASADPVADFAQLAERRRLLLLGLAVLVLFAVVGSYAVLRGVSRELEIAQLKSDFVAAVSHEFRTPLTSLRQLAELLRSGRVTSDERRARYYEIMERESGRLHRLVEGLLDFARMDAGAMEFAWDRVTPCELVQNVVTEFEAQMGEGGRRVELQVDGPLPAVRADGESLRRAVWNLLDNAVKYSPEGAAVGVSVSRVRDRVAIAVRDHGVGIPPAERDTIFGKFVRGTSSDGRAIKGTGIGLAMVKHIVEAHGGEIRVDSEVGAGSTFTILLPAGG
jgi:signal transduction histidine kinase